MKDTLAKNGLMLGTFAVITTALIAMTFFATEPRIEQQKARKLLSVLNEVVPHKLHDNAMYADCTEVVSKQLGNTLPHRVYRATLNGAPSALVLEATAPDGYSGDIELSGPRSLLYPRQLWLRRGSLVRWRHHDRDRAWKNGIPWIQ